MSESVGTFTTKFHEKTTSKFRVSKKKGTLLIKSNTSDNLMLIWPELE